MRSYLLALSFLTILPVKSITMAKEEDMERSLYYYPLVGITLGIILAAFSWLFFTLDLGLAGDAFLIALLVILTGGLHLDGLMDTADGLMSRKGRNEKLEIMKDSRVGAMGVTACILILILKVAFVAEIPYPEKIWALILTPAVGRWTCVYGIIKFPYARSNLGSRSLFSLNNKNLILFVTIISVIVLGVLFFSWKGLLIFGIAFIFCHLVFSLINKNLAGLTGDNYGALVELTETLVFFIVVILGRVVING